MMTISQLCKHIMHMIHAQIHVYDINGKLKTVYGNEGGCQDLFLGDKEFLELLLKKRDQNKPIIYLETQQIIYGIVSDAEELYLVGPCCLDKNVVSASKYLIKMHGLDGKKIYPIYSTSLYMFCEIISMLFEMLSGKTLTRDEVMLQCFCDEQFKDIVQKKLLEVSFSLRENNVVHNPYSQEIREQNAIKNGDLDELQESFRQTYAGELGILAKDELRQYKNLDIVLIVLACRSAIAGGLLPEIAFSMSDAFIQRTEELKSVEEAMVFGRYAEMEYCKAVKKLIGRPRTNPILIQCKELIVQQLYTQISVKKLAHQLDINPDYLSRLFLKEEGVRLTEYIMCEKIEEAKMQLIYTDKTYDEIACTLGFASQSHFGKVFKRFNGMTPRQFQKMQKKDG